MNVARAGRHGVHSAVQRADVVGVRAAAAADDAHARAHHIHHRAGEILRRQVIMPINRVGQTRVRFGNHGQGCHTAKLLKERQQLLRPLRAVQPNRVRAQAFQRPRHGRNCAAGEGAPGRVEAHRHPHRQRRMLLRGKQGGFCLVQVGHRLDADEVSARVHARVHNLREHIHRRLERQRAHRFEQFAQGPNIQRDAGGCADARLFRRCNGGRHHIRHRVGRFLHLPPIRPERVRIDDFRARFDILPVDIRQQIRVGDSKQLRNFTEL